MWVSPALASVEESVPTTVLTALFSAIELADRLISVGATPSSLPDSTTSKVLAARLGRTAAIVRSETTS